MPRSSGLESRVSAASSLRSGVRCDQVKASIKGSGSEDSTPAVPVEDELSAGARGLERLQERVPKVHAQRGTLGRLHVGRKTDNLLMSCL